MKLAAVPVPDEVLRSIPRRGRQRLVVSIFFLFLFLFLLSFFPFSSLSRFIPHVNAALIAD